MEKTKVQYILIVSLVLGLLVGQSTASFISCNEGCFLKCILTPGKSRLSCTGKCLSKCLFSASVNYVKDKKNFCKLGCVTSLCTKDSAGEEKVDSCVESCSKTCTKD